MQAIERSCDSKMEGLRPDKFAFAKRSEAMKAPVGLSSDRTVLRQQDGGVSLRQVRVCRPMLNKCTTIIDKPCVQDYNKIIGYLGDLHTGGLDRIHGKYDGAGAVCGCPANPTGNG